MEISTLNEAMSVCLIALQNIDQIPEFQHFLFPLIPIKKKNAHKLADLKHRFFFNICTCMTVCMFVCGNVSTHFPWLIYRYQRTTQLSALPFFLVGDKIVFSPLYQTRLNSHDLLGTGYKCVLLCLPMYRSCECELGSSGLCVFCESELGLQVCLASTFPMDLLPQLRYTRFFLQL